MTSALPSTRVILDDGHAWNFPSSGRLAYDGESLGPGPIDRTAVRQFEASRTTGDPAMRRSVAFSLIVLAFSLNMTISVHAFQTGGVPGGPGFTGSPGGGFTGPRGGGFTDSLGPTVGADNGVGLNLLQVYRMRRGGAVSTSSYGSRTPVEIGDYAVEATGSIIPESIAWELAGIILTRGITKSGFMATGSAIIPAASAGVLSDLAIRVFRVQVPAASPESVWDGDCRPGCLAPCSTRTATFPIQSI